MTSDSHCLFVYGTLKDAEMRRALFGAEVPHREGVLANYRLQSSDGFFFVAPHPHSEVRGLVLDLTEDQLLLADQWEEIPFYSRTIARVSCNGHPCEAWVYTRPGVSGVPADPSAASTMPKDEVLGLIGDFRHQLSGSSLPYSDAYILLPCLVGQKKGHPSRAEQPRASFETSFIKQLENICRSEFSGNLTDHIARDFLPMIEIAACTADDNGILGFEKASVIASHFTLSKYGVLTLVIPAVSVSLLHVLDQVSSGRLKVRDAGTKEFLPIETYFSDQGFSLHGTPRVAVFMKQPPAFKDLVSLLMCEVDSPAPITGTQLLNNAKENIAQYESAEIYASDICVVELPRHFSPQYEERLCGQLLTLFILEIMQLQESALRAVSDNVYRMIGAQAYKSDLLALTQIEEVTEEYAKAMLLWDTNNFKYRSAQTLANELARKFDMKRKFEVFFQYKDVVEQLTQVHSSRINIAETKVLNHVLLLLAFIQIVPVIFSVVQSLTEKTPGLSDLVSALTSVASCFLIWMVFKLVNRKAPTSK
jgi:gamma-glutamylcyclotransferase (GGCT)/AIG2-like uncharacterized protein YtfP